MQSGVVYSKKPVIQAARAVYFMENFSSLSQTLLPIKPLRREKRN